MNRTASRGALTETAYRYVRDGIVRGTIPTGTVVAEQAVAAAIGSSRTPVRHALSKLLQEGLLEVGPRRQLIVRGFTPEHLAEIRLLRQALEGVARVPAGRSPATSSTSCISTCCGSAAAGRLSSSRTTVRNRRAGSF